MHFKIVCVLLLLKCLKIDARGRIPIGRTLPLSTELPPTFVNTTESLSLPGGFNPLPPPMQPLLYPFATEQPPRNTTSTTPGWRPIVTDRISARSSSFQTQVQHSLPTSTESQQDFSPLPSFKETVVYGTWKPEPPLIPAILGGKNSSKEQSKSKEISNPIQSTVRRRTGGFLGEVERKKYFEDSLEKSSNTESFELSKPSNKSNKKPGRRKILTSHEKKTIDPMIKSRIVNAMNVIRVNASDPELLKMAKQINESIEATTETSQKQKIRNNTSSASIEQNNTSNQNIPISKEWPTDFVTSNENSRSGQENSEAQENYYHFFGDSSEPPQALAGINFDEVLSPPTSFNITKLGVPYENQNSGEDPSICVPLSVRERSASNSNEVIEVERVYCFPLPPSSDAKQITDNETLTFDKDAQFSVLSYEELSTSSSMRQVKSIFWFIGLSVLWT